MDLFFSCSIQVPVWILPDHWDQPLLWMFGITTGYVKRGGVIGGLFPVFRKKYLPFPAFRGFFSGFPVTATFPCLFGLFRLSAASKSIFPVFTNFKLCFPVSAIFSNFSGFLWLKNVIFRFPTQMFFLVFRRTFLVFTVFCDFLRPFRLSAKSITAPHHASLSSARTR